MYHIYVFCLFALGFIISTVSKVFIFQPQTDGWLTFSVFQCLFIAAMLIDVAVMTLNNMYLRQEFRRHCESVITYKKKIALTEERYMQLKVYIEGYLGEKYPEFEKDIITKIGTQPSGLTVLFQSFPELKTSDVFSDLVNRITNLSQESFSLKKEIENKYEDIRNIKRSPWIFGKILTYISEGQEF